MINTFADKETEEVYHQQFSKKLLQAIQRVAKMEEVMTEMISTPKISEILLEEFMNPLQISAYRLAMDIHVPTSRILEILHDKRKITADTSIRLGRYFGVSDSYFLNLQGDIDIRNELLKSEDEFVMIQQVKYA